MAYQIFTDATADLNTELTAGLPAVAVIPMQIQIGGQEYTFGRGENIDAKEFYRLQREGSFASTSQINPEVYIQYFEPFLRCGMDILYLCFSSGMSGTIQSANLGIRELQEKYPGQKIICIDTLCASLGEGFLVREALKRQAKGMELEELADWIESNKKRVCHWFTVDVFEHLRHGGRVSAMAATMGTILQIKPTIRVDDEGKLDVVEKCRGPKRALTVMLSHLEQDCCLPLGNTVVVGHGDCPGKAEELKTAVLEKFPEMQVIVAEIGPVIGAHTGPGMLALIFWGKNR